MRANVFCNVHLVSDSTGETLNAIMRATMPLFENVTPIENSYYLVRSRRQLERVMGEIEQTPGIILFTIANEELRSLLEERAAQISMPCVAVLDPILDKVSRYLGVEQTHRVAANRALDDSYFKRIDALNFAMAHDDGQNVPHFENADVVLIGVSRTSKTPTSIYLANRGVRTANYPLVPHAPVPPSLLTLKRPLVVGLKVSPDRLVAIRRNRLLSLNEERDTDYVDEESVRSEVTFANRLFEKTGWPVIDVTRRSIEETAAAVLNLLSERKRDG
jgi:[pyruvate, water dikinase]-phosphate phosphotransferase / [pyruvate, water dikinase] kinase